MKQIECFSSYYLTDLQNNVNIFLRENNKSTPEIKEVTYISSKERWFCWITYNLKETEK